MNINEILDGYHLTDEEKQILADAINYGWWGGAEFEFIVDGELETCAMDGFCTNDAQDAGHFDGRNRSALFKSIYRKMCPKYKNTIGEILSHCRDWWEDGTGDMLFIHKDYSNEFIEWAKTLI